MNEHSASEANVLVLEKGDSIKGAIASRLRAEGIAAATGELNSQAEAMALGGFDAMVLAVEEVEARHYELIDRLSSEAESPEIIVLAERAGVSDAVQAMRMGSFHFMLRPCRVKEVEAVIQEALAKRRRRADGKLELALGEFASTSRLTRREIEIVRCLAEGLSNQKIAKHLDITEHTVKTHLKNIFGKLNVRSRTQVLGLVFRLLDRGPERC